MGDSQEPTTSTITIYFWGLMYFQLEPKSGDPLKVGILQGAPGHRYSVRVSWNANEVDVSDYVTPECRNWTLEVAKISGASVSRRTTRRADAGFNRLNSTHDLRDCQWLVNFRDLYPEGYTKHEDMLLPNITIRTGNFLTECATVPLRYKQGSTHGYFGRIAEIMALEVSLMDDEQLVLRASTTGEAQANVILLRKPALQQEYMAFLNLPPEHLLMGKQAGTAAQPQPHEEEQYQGSGTPAQPQLHEEEHDHGSGLPTHFQNYYLFIPKLLAERVDFTLGDEPPGTGCPLPKGLDRWVKKRPFSPSPYFCGPIGGG